MDGEGRGFVLHTSEGESELDIDEVRAMADSGDPDGLYAFSMAYLFGWDVDEDQEKGYM